MKQTEKLDLALKFLCEKPRGQYFDLVQLFKESGIEISLDDARVLGQRLSNSDYAKYTSTYGSVHVSIRSEGIEFVEGDSFTHKGNSVITTYYSISNSPNANLISHAGQVTITQHSVIQAKSILERIREVASKDNTIDRIKREEILECADEVETGVNAGKTPKYALMSLIKLGADVAAIGDLVLQLKNIIMPGS